VCVYINIYMCMSVRFIREEYGSCMMTERMTAKDAEGNNEG